MEVMAKGKNRQRKVSSMVVEGCKINFKKFDHYNIEKKIFVLTMISFTYTIDVSNSHKIFLKIKSINFILLNVA